MSTSTSGSGNRGISSSPPPPPPPPPPPASSHQSSSTFPLRPPHPLSIISATPHTASQLSYTHPANDYYSTRGRYVPHVVMVSLDTTPVPEDIRESKISNGKLAGAVARGYRPRLGQLLEACPLDPNKASAITCVKFSPSTDFCLIGYGVREPAVEGGGNFHPVTAVYRIRGGMTHVSTMLSGDDDVNIARFHPDSGHSFVYGTKQGRVRVLSPRPWNFYGQLENPGD
jgi:activator-of-BECN1-regulated-autophagy protein 1